MPGLTLSARAKHDRALQIHPVRNSITGSHNLSPRRSGDPGFRRVQNHLSGAAQPDQSAAPLSRNYAAATRPNDYREACLWPLQNKANRSMRRMSALSPKMQELRDKYKDDPTRMNQEVMKLYKDYGINPVSGCLPMLIQIPIFFGLFTMLRQAVELRNASSFGCTIFPSRTPSRTSRARVGQSTFCR